MRILYLLLITSLAITVRSDQQFFRDTLQRTTFLQPQTSLGPTLIKILNEFSFNIWQGFLEGFKQEEAHLQRDSCFGSYALQRMQSILKLTESATKELFFQNLAQVVRDVVLLVVDVKDNC